MTGGDNRLPNDQWTYDPKAHPPKIMYNPSVLPGSGVVLTEDRLGVSELSVRLQSARADQAGRANPGADQGDRANLARRGKWYPTDPWKLHQADMLEMRPKNLPVQSPDALSGCPDLHEGNRKRVPFCSSAVIRTHNPRGNTEWFPQTTAQALIDYQLGSSDTFQIFKIFQSHEHPLVQRDGAEVKKQAM